ILAMNADNAGYFLAGLAAARRLPAAFAWLAVHLPVRHPAHRFLQLALDLRIQFLETRPGAVLLFALQRTHRAGRPRRFGLFEGRRILRFLCIAHDRILESPARSASDGSAGLSCSGLVNHLESVP